LAKLIVTGPLYQFNLGDQHRLDPMAALHTEGVSAWR
jgi:hypothetical protein